MPFPATTFPRRTSVAFIIALGFAWWWGVANRAPAAMSRPIVRVANRPPSPPAKLPTPTAHPNAPEPRSTVADAPPAAPRPSRQEVVAYLTATYRQELFARELELEQRRYREHYWQADQSGPALARLAADRDALIAQLTAEANEVLASTCGGAPGAEIELPPIFDDDHPGPNLAFLSAAARNAFTAAAAAAPAYDNLGQIADATLTGPELTLYHAWNDRANAALRNELVGFEPSEGEFLAVRGAQSARALDPDTAAATPMLAAQLGAERFADLLRIQSPEMRTALHELDQVGLPLSDATWLARTRQAAIAAIQRVWQDPSIPAEAKPAHVAVLQRTYGREIAAKLALTRSTIDELGVPR